MDVGATLGEILAAALTGVVRTPDEIEQEALNRAYADAQLTTSRALARLLSAHLGITEDEAWGSICTVPDNLLSLLCSPQGWTAIADMVAADNQLAGSAFLPTVH